MQIPQIKKNRRVDVCILSFAQQQQIENSPNLKGGPRGSQLAKDITYSEALATYRLSALQEQSGAVLVFYATGTMRVVETH